MSLLFKANGKELQDEVIDGKKLQWYDYGARNYDPSIGRFFNIDPMADEASQIHNSPYAYVLNNPVNMIDPTGMVAEELEEHSQSEQQQQAKNIKRHREALGNYEYSFVSPAVYKIKLADGTVKIVNKKEYKKALKNGAKKVSNEEFNNSGCCGTEGSFETALAIQEAFNPPPSHGRCSLCDGRSEIDYVGGSLIFARIGKTSSLLALNLSQFSDVASLATASQLRWFGRGAALLTVSIHYYRWRSGEISGSKFAQESAWTGIGVFGGGPGLILSSLYWFAGDVLGGNEMAQRRFEFRQRQRVEDPEAFWEYVREQGKKCFVRGTKVLMSDLSEKNIENIKIGDKILGVNMNNFKFEEDKVINVTKFKSKKIIKMVLSNSNTIEFTNDHPFWVVGKGWSVFNVQVAKTRLEFEVNQMEEKDYILIYDNGKLLPLQIIELYDTKEFKAVYNLDNVEKNNTFFANKVLVHNRAN